MKPDDLDIRVLFPSEFLKADDLRGRPVTVTLTGASKEDVPMTGGKKNRMLVMRMGKTNKRLIIGKTNGWSLGVLISPRAVDWVGKRVTLVADLDLLNKNVVPAVRIQGSPDATPERQRAYAEAWKGDRMGGRLCARLKRALSMLEMGAPPPPVEPEVEEADHGDAPEAASEPDLFDDENEKHDEKQPENPTP